MSNKEQQDNIEHVFRHEYGSLVATLVRRVGIQHVEMIEDAVQWSMTQALTHWALDKKPDNQAAWLYQVAHRHLLSEFRNTVRHQVILNNEYEQQDIEFSRDIEASLSSELSDALLRMLFLACDDHIPIESQLVFTLKSLCGFSVSEIAARLFVSEANVYKRFIRAKSVLIKQKFNMDEINQSLIKQRISAVHRVLYLVFTEGYLSSHPDVLIRNDLCEEASRLTLLLIQNPICNVPESHALLALMYFNIARLDTREDQAGLVLLAQQDRSMWDQQKITQAMEHLMQSGQGDIISRYHIEANIAAEHCMAVNYQDTRWDKIVGSYELLENVAPSALHILNRALAMAEWKNAKQGLEVLQRADIPTWLTRSYHWYAVLADLQYRDKQYKSAKKNAEQAIHLAPTKGIKDLLKRRIANYNTNKSIKNSPRHSL